MIDLQHHADGSIHIHGDTDEYHGTAEEFAALFTEKLPDLPHGALFRLYRQGGFHSIQNSRDVIAGGPMPWPLGDRIITAMAQHMVKRETAASPLPEPPKEASDAQRRPKRK